MNHLSIIHKNLSEFNLPEPRKNPTGEVTHEELKLMVENNREAALMGIQPKDPRLATKLCFEKVDTHFGAVSALLQNNQVFECVKRTLRGIKKNGGVEQEKKAVAVTLAALESGQAMDACSEEWPAAVCQVLLERSKSRDKYWIDKGEKFRTFHKYDSSVSGPILILCKPFVFPDPEKLTKPFKFPIELEERSVHELHFVQAFLDHPKSILKKLSAVDLSTLDFAQLEANNLKALKGRAHSVVHVVPENLGKLLARLSSRVSKGGQFDLRGQCCRWGVAEATRVFQRPFEAAEPRLSPRWAACSFASAF